jgi:hypothetical protein
MERSDVFCSRPEGSNSTVGLRGDRILNFVVGDPKSFRRTTIEPLGAFVESLIATTFHVETNLANHRLYFVCNDLAAFKQLPVLPRR